MSIFEKTAFTVVIHYLYGNGTTHLLFETQNQGKLRNKDCQSNSRFWTIFQPRKSDRTVQALQISVVVPIPSLPVDNLLNVDFPGPGFTNDEHHNFLITPFNILNIQTHHIQLGQKVRFFLTHIWQKCNVK